jgi:hypothetical protein
MSAYTRRQLLESVSSGLSIAIPARAMLKADTPALDPTIKTRMFWTWDHSTEWALNRPGAQTLGASNPYSRTTQVFLQDYTEVLNWCRGHNIDAVVVWGLLRDSHGGLDAAKRLCDVASKKGVRLLCGVGLNAYGGVYYEGSSSYSLERHLESNPELYAFDSDGKKMVFNLGVNGPRLSHHACPSRPENQDFAAESLRWLFKNLPLGGVQIETGDTGVCQCARCKTRRRHPSSTFSWEDMMLMYPIAADAIRSVSPDAWIICETYSHPEPFVKPDKIPKFGEGKPAWADACLARFPRDVFVQWVCDDYVRPKSLAPWTSSGTVSSAAHRNIMRAHFSTFWEGLRGELAIDWIADMVQQSLRHGFDAISLFGEVSPFHAGSELNYLALTNYGSAGNPQAKLDVFLRDVAGPLLGGEKQARDYLRYARLLADRPRVPDALKEIYPLSATLPARAAQRWVWLANYLASFVAA